MADDIEGHLEYLKTRAEGTPASVLDHVGNVLVKLTAFGADRPIDYFEPFSYLIKETEYAQNEKIAAIQEKPVVDLVAALEKKVRIQSQLFPKAKLTAEGEEEEEDKNEETNEEEEEEMVNEGEVPNVAQQMRFLSAVGIGLTENETRLLQLSIQKLVRSKPLATARFWGKVQTKEGFYYVVEAEYNDGERPHEGSAAEEEDKQEEAPEEKRPPMEEDVGPNLYNYFACTYLGGSWTLLPDIHPHHIVASRSIREYFTGDLKAEVNAPEGRFEGNESHLLRCMIARITHSCTLAPKGLYMPEEEPEEDQELDSNAAITQVEEFNFKPLKNMSGFVHRLPVILPQGRTEFWTPETEEEDNNVVVETGPSILRPISEDEPLPDGTPSWTFRAVNTPQKIFWLRSNAWPGLHIVTNETGEHMSMVYFGWGMKSQEPLEWPPLPEPKKVVKPVEEEEEEEDQNAETKEGEEEEDGTEEKQKEAPQEEEHESENTYETGTYEDSNA